MVDQWNLALGDLVSVAGNRPGLTPVRGRVVSVGEAGFDVEVEEADGQALAIRRVVPVLWADVGSLEKDISSSIMLTTSYQFDGREIERHLGVVGGQAAMGVNAFKDLAAGFRDVFGGRSGVYERELDRARDIALRDMAKKAAVGGADAVVAVSIQYTTVGGSGAMFLVAATGTAVRLKS